MKLVKFTSQHATSTVNINLSIEPAIVKSSCIQHFLLSLLGWHKYNVQQAVFYNFLLKVFKTCRSSSIVDLPTRIITLPGFRFPIGCFVASIRGYQWKFLEKIRRLKFDIFYSIHALKIFVKLNYKNWNVRFVCYVINYLILTMYI